MKSRWFVKVSKNFGVFHKKWTTILRSTKQTLWFNWQRTKYTEPTSTNPILGAAAIFTKFKYIVESKCKNQAFKKNFRHENRFYEMSF